MKRKPIQLSIVGKPNAGKSTLVNALLKEQRVIANDLAGTTRDAIRVQWVYAGRRITLVDTAGIKVGKRNETLVDFKVQKDVHDAIKYSHVVAVMIDSMEAFTSADMSLVKMVLDEGRAVVVIANKWDLVDEKYKKKAVKWMEKQLEKGLG
jgi:GTPase